MQSKYHSLIESIANVLIGYLVAVGSQMFIFPIFGIAVSVSDNFLIGLWFTAISIVRSYCLRRFFTKKTEGRTVKVKWFGSKYFFCRFERNIFFVSLFILALSTLILYLIGVFR